MTTPRRACPAVAATPCEWGCGSSCVREAEAARKDYVRRKNEQAKGFTKEQREAFRAAHPEASGNDAVIDAVLDIVRAAGRDQ